MDIFDPIIQVFTYISSIFQIIIDGITGTIDIITSLFNLFVNVCKILPNPLYSCLLTFLTIYVSIFTFKIFRKG